MSGAQDGPGRTNTGTDPKDSKRRRRWCAVAGRFSLIWLIPIVAGAIAAYLVITTLANRGPLITIRFKTASGLSAQQTQVTHKAVSLGMVEGIELTHDMRTVLVHVRMNSQGADILTDHARFWVVRPRLSTGNISGLETLVSGAYIEVDPGSPGGQSKRDFEGLDDPPGMRSDEPGHGYTLTASRLGSIGPGAPVFYRDVTVGEVLSYDLGNGLGPVQINIFVTKPFDQFVHQDTHFWNASGISVSVGAQGLHVELASLQAILSGGIAFETPHVRRSRRSADRTSSFPSTRTRRMPTPRASARRSRSSTYFTSSVSGLSRGSPVQVFGIQIGTVTDVRLVMEKNGQGTRARVAYELQPERVFGSQQRAIPIRRRWCRRWWARACGRCWNPAAS